MGDRYPLALWKDGTQYRVWNAYDVELRIVQDENEEEEALADGWRLTPNSLTDADGDGEMGGSVDGWDQFSDEDLRAAIGERGISVHHKTGRARMPQMLRNESEAA